MQRYGRSKVVATLVTFGTLWVWINFFAPDWRDNLRGVGTRTPGAAFRERRDGEWVQARAVVETALPDSVVIGMMFRQARLRSLDGHPFTLLLEPGDERLPTVGDTVHVRGVYGWDLKGGVVTIPEDGWLRAAR